MEYTMNPTLNFLNRIEINPNVMVGKPVVRGTRIPVAFIIGLLSAGYTDQEILDEYKKIDKQDISACLLYAKQLIEQVYQAK